MFCTTSKTEGEVGAVKLVLLWFSVSYFGVRVSVTFHLTWVHIIFSSVSVAKWPPFGK